KTTLLNSLGLLLPVKAGAIEYDGSDATHWSSRRIRRFWRDEASFVIQNAGIDQDESVLYNVSLQKRRFHATKQLAKKATSALSQVGLSNRASERARVLSGGEQRRVAIARAIYRQASIVFADEPTASLDADNRLLVQSLLLDEARRGALVIASTHDRELANAATKVIDLSRYVAQPSASETRSTRKANVLSHLRLRRVEKH
ncbi:MAG: ATP-binding cassette domain-containing protein, partial [Actinomycetaceae bacterium]|nr:ATP-binding cassette domain-containing protein [Actinomycetaceae bacterium]